MALLATLWSSVSSFFTSLTLQVLKWVGIYYIFTKPERIRRKLAEEALERSIQRKEKVDEVSSIDDSTLDERLRRYQRN